MSLETVDAEGSLDVARPTSKFFKSKGIMHTRDSQRTSEYRSSQHNSTESCSEESSSRSSTGRRSSTSCGKKCAVKSSSLAGSRADQTRQRCSLMAL